MRLPESWVETSVGKVIVDLQPGFAQKPGEDDDGMTPQIRTHNISPEGRIALEGIKHVSASAKEIEKYRLDPDDVVFNNTNSEEWVGKTALFDRQGTFVFSNHMTRLRADPSLINPQFLARYLHYLWSLGYSKSRAKRWVSQAGIESVALASFKLPLPTLLEQQRIIEILQQAEAVKQEQQRFDELLVRAKHQLFIEMLGDPRPKGNDKWPIIKLGTVVTVGTGGTPSREKAESYGGTIAWAKSTDLTDEPISSTEETLTALGVQNSNATIWPKGTVLLAMYGQGQTRGRTGKLLIEAACNQACAALLPNDELLPDYLWVWFQLSYDAVRSLGRGGQQENLNLDIIRNITLPRPPTDLQQEFSRRLDQLLSVAQAAATARKQTDPLLNVLRAEALHGSVTAAWRERNRDKLLAAAHDRDAALRDRGIKVTKQIRSRAELLPGPVMSGPAREWLVNELSEFQKSVFEAFIAYPRQPLLAEDQDRFDDFCNNDELAARLEGLLVSPIRIRRTLGQLSALGLIAKITVPKTNLTTGEREYLKAFRPLRSDESSRLADIERLTRALDGEIPTEGGATE